MKAEETSDHTGMVHSSYHAMCRHWGLPYHVVIKREKRGWSRERALTTRLLDEREKHARQVLTRWQKDWAAKLGITREGLAYRVKAGVPLTAPRREQ